MPSKIKESEHKVKKYLIAKNKDILFYKLYFYFIK